MRVNRWTYDPVSNYHNFLNLVIHEYLHVWIVKRLRPVSLVSYDYTMENYSDLLWAMEGIPSYYDDIMLCRLGYITSDDYLRRLSGAINSVESQPGQQVRSVAQASFDAWIKEYQPDENQVNSTVSYYTKGNVLAAMIDLEILGSTQGQAGLRDLLKDLYRRYYKDQFTGFTLNDFKSGMTRLTGKNYDGFFDQYVTGIVPVPYDQYLKYAGVGIYDLAENNTEAYFGAVLNDEAGKTMIRSVYSGSPAQVSGIAPGDELLSYDGYRASSESFLRYLNNRNPGDTLKLIISRQDLVREKTVVVGHSALRHFNIFINSNSGAGEKKILEKWLAP
jgi:predicted metalloprotease with PDZ domain